MLFKQLGNYFMLRAPSHSNSLESLLNLHQDIWGKIATLSGAYNSLRATNRQLRSQTDELIKTININMLGDSNYDKVEGKKLSLDRFGALTTINIKLKNSLQLTSSLNKFAEFLAKVKIEIHPENINSAIDIIKQLTQNVADYSLYLENNNIGAAGAKDIAAALEKSQLTSLNLNCSSIGDAGAKDIAAALEKSKLTSLSLRYNKIGDAGAKYLADAGFVNDGTGRYKASEELIARRAAAALRPEPSPTVGSGSVQITVSKQ